MKSSGITGKTSIAIQASVSRVWDALTQPELIKQYLFGTETNTSWKPGSPITFSGEHEGKKYEDKGTVLAVDFHRLIRYNYWSSMSGVEDRPENYVTITYELSESGPGETRLDLIQENIPDEKTKEHSLQNWNKVLSSLKNMLEEKAGSR